MMKHNHSFYQRFSIGLFLTFIVLFSVSAQSGVEQLRNLGFVPAQRDGATEYIQVVDGISVTILPNPQVNSASLGFLRELQELVESFTVIKPENITITLRSQESIGVVRITSLLLGDRQLVQLLPEGIVFRYQNNLVYDFSMVIDRLRLRIRGQYLGELELVEKLGRIAGNPSEYVLSQDSEYMFRFMQEMRDANDLITEKLEVAENRIIELEQEYRTLVDGLIILNSKSFFGGLNEFDRQAVKSLVDWRMNNPAVTQKEAEAWLKNGGYDLSSKVVQAVLVLYFNQVE